MAPEDHLRGVYLEDGGAELPVYISADNFKPFISKDLDVAPSNPIIYRSKTGLAYGLRAELLADVQPVVLDATSDPRPRICEIGPGTGCPPSSGTANRTRFCIQRLTTFHVVAT